MTNSPGEVLIVGAGLAGLSCALTLQKAGVPFQLFESSDAVGGRVRTDNVDGFLLDRGFQIFLTAYEEAAEILDYQALDFRPFMPGAMVRAGSRFHLLADPIRCPSKILETIAAPVGTMSDKLKVARLKFDLASTSETISQPQTTLQSLKSRGFSDEMIAKFFRPFLSGIFLETELETASNVFEFILRTLSQGDNVLPALGMQSIPAQIASRLPREKLTFNSEVRAVGNRSLTLSSGHKINGSAIVVATDKPHAAMLTGDKKTADCRSQICMYFAAEKPPINEPVLVLNGDGSGPVNNFCVPSNVAPTYAPRGKALLSAALVGDIATPQPTLESAVRSQMKEWFGDQVNSWQHLRTYRIKNALPDQSPQAQADCRRGYNSESGIYTCGDYRETGSINGALLSGRKAAEALIVDLCL